MFQGYTPLHIAMQFGHEEIFNLLKDVYGKVALQINFQQKYKHEKNLIVILIKIRTLNLLESIFKF